VALNAAIFYSDGYFALDLYPGEARDRVGADPPVADWDPRSPIWLYWNGEKLDRDEYEFEGLTVVRLGRLTECDVAALERVPLPQVSCPEVGLIDVEVADVLLWAKKTYRGPGVHRVGWATAAKR